MTRLTRLATAAMCALTLALPAVTASAAPAPGPATPVSPSATGDVHPELPRPTGPYAVGRSTLHLVDRARRDPWVPEARPRELMVTLFYPARGGSGSPARYATIEEARLYLRSQGVPDAATAEALSATGTSGRTGAVPVPGSHPLVVLSPGFGAPRYSLTGLAEELAARGYVVAALDHAHESVGTEFPGGRMLTCRACEQVRTEEDLRAVTVGRARDVSFVLDRLTGPRPAWRYAHLIDRRRIGAGGHSIGGAAALSAMAGDHRVRVGVNLDGAVHDPVPDSGLGGRPVLMLGTDDGVHRPGGRDATWDRTWRRLDGWKRWLTVAGADHLSFSDHSVLAEQLGLPGPAPALPGTRAIALTREFVAGCFDLHLRHIPQPELDGPTPADPEVVFHSP
ncbi:acetylhydrolase [Streptomyces albus subsp. albus]|nr:acetylhydrolase [Streptomyces albus subsp. albus]